MTSVHPDKNSLVIHTRPLSPTRRQDMESVSPSESRTGTLDTAENGTPSWVEEETRGGGGGVGGVGAAAGTAVPPPPETRETTKGAAEHTGKRGSYGESRETGGSGTGRDTTTDSETEADTDEVHNVETIWFCSLIARHPKKSFGVIGGFHLAMALMTGIMYLAGYDILPIDFKNIPLNLLKDDTFQRAEAWLWRDESDILLPKIFETTQTAPRTVEDDNFAIMYDLEGKGENIFTKSNLKLIQEAEQNLEDTPAFTKFCWSEVNGDCKKPMSVINFFDGTYAYLDPVFNDTEFDNIVGVLAATEDYTITRNQLQYHLGKNSRIDAGQNVAFTDITRSLFSTGLPLAGYANNEDRIDDQEDQRDKWYMGSLRKALVRMSEKGVGPMDVVYDGVRMLTLEMERQIILDFALAVGSGMFIFAFLWIQTRSLFITCFALASIMSAFVITNFIYRVVLDYVYFGMFQVLSMFIILGIGADDIFVFYDHWRASALEKFESLEHRLSEVYRRSASAMFVTSLTTMSAFFVNAMSPLLMVHSFGVFSGILVCVNYLTVITFFPTAVLVYHFKWENWSWPCFKCCPWNRKKGNKLETHELQSTVVPAERSKSSEFNSSNSEKTPNGFTNKAFAGPVAVVNVTPDDSETGSEDRRPEKRSSRRKGGTKNTNYVVRFFAGPFFRFVTHKIWRWVIIVFFLAMVALMLYFAAQLRPQDEAIKIFIDRHNFGKAREKNLHSFKPNFRDYVVRINLIWGMGEQDRSSCHKTDFDCKGVTVWDQGFDLNPAPAQVSLRDFCTRLRSLTDEEAERLHLRQDVYGNYEVKCFIENMENFLKEEMTDPKYGLSGEFELPVTADKVKTLMDGNPTLYNSSVTDRTTFYRPFETAMDFWLSNGYTSRTYDYDEYSYLLGESTDQFNSYPVQGTDDYYANRLRYASITVNTSLIHVDQGYVEGLKIVKAWEEFLDEEKAKMHPSLLGGFQCTPEHGQFDNEWHWLRVQRVLVRSAWQGIVIGMSIALVVLVLASQNIIVGVLATAVICGITACAVGLIYVNGWMLSVLESINLSLIVGLAVDYVVHMAAGYHFARSKDRLGRVHQMLEDVAFSVLSGACTTLGAAFFMLFALIAFYMQFGLFMICTIGTSLLFALFFFSAVLGIIGPEGDTGSIRPLTRKCVGLFRKHKQA